MTNKDLQIRRQELCGGFWIDLRDVLNTFDCDPDAVIEAYMDAPLSAFVDLVAPNGIRPVYKKEGHISYRESPPDGE